MLKRGTRDLFAWNDDEVKLLMLDESGKVPSGMLRPNQVILKFTTPLNC